MSTHIHILLLEIIAKSQRKFVFGLAALVFSTSLMAQRGGGGPNEPISVSLTGERCAVKDVTETYTVSISATVSYTHASTSYTVTGGSIVSQDKNQVSVLWSSTGTGNVSGTAIINGNPMTVRGINVAVTQVSGSASQCGSGAVSYSLLGSYTTVDRWETRYKNGTGSWSGWSTVSGSTGSASINPTLSQWSSGARTYEVRAVISDQYCSTTYPTATTIVDAVTVGGTMSGPATSCGTGSETFSLSGHTGTIERWQKRYKNGSGSWTSWTTFAENDNITSLAVDFTQWNSGVRTYEVRAVVKSGSCTTSYPQRTITIDPQTVGGSISGSSNRCGSGTLGYSLSGHTGTIQRWQSRYKNGNGGWTSWSTITETDNVTSVSPSLSQWSGGVRTYEIQAVIKSGTCSTSYPKKTVTVDPQTVAGTVSGPSGRCGAGSESFSLAGHTGTVARWQSRYKNGDGGWSGWSTITETDNITSLSVSFSAAPSEVRTYEVRATVQSGSCGALYPQSTIQIYPATVGGSITGNIERCGSGTETFGIQGSVGTIQRWQSRYKDGSGSWTAWSTITETDNVTTVSPTLSQWNNGVRTYEVQAVVKSGTCSTSYPKKTITVNPLTVAGNVSGPVERCMAGSETFSISGHTGTVQRWQTRNKNGSGSWSSWTTVEETDNITSLSIGFVAAHLEVKTYEVRAVVKSGNCGTTLYPQSTIEINPGTVGGLITSVDEKCGSGTESFSISGNFGTILRWQSRYKNGTGSWTSWSTITETDDVTNINPTLSQWNSGVRTYEVRAVVQNETCNVIYPGKTVTVHPQTIAGTVSGPASRCDAGTESFSISGHTGTINRWQTRYKDGAGSWTSWSTVEETDDITSLNVSFAAASPEIRTYEVRAEVKSGTCASSYAQTTIEIFPTTISGSISGNSERCGSGVEPFTLNGNVGTILRWQSRNKDGAGSWTSWSTIEETDDVTSVSPNLTQWNNGIRTYEVQAVVQSGTCTQALAQKTITVHPQTIAGTLSGPASRCDAGTELFSISGHTGIIDRWQTRYKDGTGSWTSWSTVEETDDITSLNVSFVAASPEIRTYEVRAEVKSGTCATSYAQTTIEIFPTTISGSISGNSERCGSGVEPFTLNGNVGTILRWQSRSKDGAGSWTSWSTIEETDDVTSVSPSLTQWSSGVRTYEVQAVVQSGTCTQALVQKTITVHPQSVGGTVDGSKDDFGVSSGVLTLSGHTGNVVKWQLKTTEDWVDVANTSISLTFTNVTVDTQYRAIVASGTCGEIASSIALINILNVPSLDLGLTTSLRPGVGDTLTASTGHSNYQWFLDNIQVKNGADNTLIATTPGAYKVTVTSVGGATYTTGDAILDSQLELNENAILSYTYRKEVPATNPPDDFDFNLDELSIDVSVYDGLGRAVQNISLNSSPDRNDVVAPVEYDPFGRKVKEYLPYINDNVGGIYKPNALVEQPGFYFDIKESSKAYTETRFEESPLNRPVEQGSPGDNRVIGGGNTVAMDYEINGENEVVEWDNSDLSNLSGTFYPRGELYKSIVTDEDGNQTIEYTNKQGQTILKKSQVDATIWASTYYIYDDYGRLRVVLPPEAVRQMSTDVFGSNDGTLLLADYTLTQADVNSKFTYLSGVVVTVPAGLTLGSNFELVLLNEVGVSTQTRDDFAFSYEYDGRNRMISKKVPGAHRVDMVYDRWDRLVLTQDGKQRNDDEWLFTTYDVLNRPVMTGFITDSRDRATLQTYVGGLNDRFLTFTTATGTGVTRGYQNDAYPLKDIDTGTLGDILTVTYYDRYDFIAQTDLSGTSYDPSNTEPEDNFIATENTKVKGQVTGSLTRGEGGDFITTITYYDDKYRPIQIVSENHLGGNDIISNQYDFVGNVIRARTKHTVTPANATASLMHTIIREYAYDHRDRLLSVHHQIDDNDKALIATNDYNEIGELAAKNLHGGEQTLNYDYNIRGWLESINDPAALGTDLFGMKLLYDEQDATLGNTQLYNGNISAMEWSNYDPENTGIDERAYTYTYDKLNRLKDAAHFEDGSSSANDSYDVAIPEYDLNGNIKSLVRKDAGGSAMDDLSYFYDGNQLTQVDDAGDDGAGFTETTTGIDYTYDDNGNMQTDANKGITSITYNHLNLPTKVVLSPTGEDDRIEYLYDAAGIKLQQKVYEGGNLSKTTDYVGEFIYEAEGPTGEGKLHLIQHEEGRLIYKTFDDKWDYQYHLKDHLGNVRLTFSTTPDIYPRTATMELNEEQDAFDPWVQSPRNGLATTGNASANVMRLNTDVQGNGSVIEGILGLSIMYEVQQGDKFDLEVKAYYEQAPVADGFFANNLLFNMLVTGSTGSSPSNENTITNNSNLNETIVGGIQADKNSIVNTTVPRAYMNWLLFDKDTILLNAGFKQIGSASNNNWETLMTDEPIEIEQNGFFFAYVSNETNASSIVDFDDFKVTLTKTNVVSTQDYYPFGLTFNESQRTASVKNFMNTFQDQEYEEETGWVKFKWRNHQPEIGRFFNVDPLAEEYVHNSVYAFSENKVVRHIELEGAEAQIAYVIADAIKNKVMEKAIESGANPSEAVVLSNTPMAWLKNKELSQNRETAYIISANVMQQGGEDGLQDALRHGIFTALNAQTLGKETALELGEAHENLPDNPDNKKTMDLHNNNIGAIIGAKKPNASPKELMGYLLNAMKAGGMKVIDNDGNVVGTKLTGKDAQVAFYNLQTLNSQGVDQQNQESDEEKSNYGSE